MPQRQRSTFLRRNQFAESRNRTHNALPKPNPLHRHSLSACPRTTYRNTPRHAAPRCNATGATPRLSDERCSPPLFSKRHENAMTAAATKAGPSREHKRARSTLLPAARGINRDRTLGAVRPSFRRRSARKSPWRNQLTTVRVGHRRLHPGCGFPVQIKTNTDKPRQSRPDQNRRTIS